MKSTTYILFSEQSNRYLIGHTNNLEKRVQDHNTPGRNEFRRGAPWLLLFHEEYAETSMAKYRATHLRGFKRTALDRLLFNHQWRVRLAV